MWPPMSDPLVNSMASPKLVSRIIQVAIVTDCEEPLDEDNNNFERKQKPMMPQNIPIEKSYMTKGEDHLRLEMLIDRLLVDGLYLSVTAMVDLSMEVVKGFQEVDL